MSNGVLVGLSNLHYRSDFDDAGAVYRSPLSSRRSGRIGPP